MKLNNYLNFILFIICLFTNYNLVYAQFTCSTTVSSSNMPITVFNTAGGTNSSNGLKISVSGSGNIQVVRENRNQIFSPYSSVTNSPTSSPSTTHGWILGIGTPYSYTQYRSNGLNPSGSNSSSTITPTAVYCRSNGNTFERELEFTITKNNLQYKYHLTYIYTIPNQYFTVVYKVVIPQGNTESVRLMHGWDTYLGSSDRGPGFISGKYPNYVMGTQKNTTTDGVVYEAFRFSSGTPWSGYYSGAYYNLSSTNFLSYNNYIDPNQNTDNGIGISIDFGYSPGTYTSTNQVIFKCNAPQVAPTVTSTNAVSTCGSPVNLRSLVTNTNLPSTVSLKAINSNGQEVNPDNITQGGTYTLYFEDSANAGCTSPSTEIVVTEVGCCSTSPVLNTTDITNSCPVNTINLNSLVQNILPSQYSIRWYTNDNHTGLPIENPTSVDTSGTYYGFIFDNNTGCYSIASSPVTVSINEECCNAGNVAPSIN